MKSQASHQLSATVMGMFSILFWGTSVALTRSLSEQLGVLSTVFYTYALTFACCVVFFIIRPKELRRVFQLPRTYLFGCGSLFVIYVVCYYFSIGLASTRSQVIEIGLINYLWPSMTLVFSVPILHKKSRITLPLGIAVACAGVVLAMSQNSTLSWDVFSRNIQLNYLPYLLAFVCAVAWSLYSNLSRRWAAHVSGIGGMAFFFMATAAIFFVIWLFVPSKATWTSGTVTELIFYVIFVSFLAYMFWDISMRRGNFILVASLAYLIPLLSTMVSCIYLGVKPGMNLLIASVLVVCGAVICRYSIIDNEKSTRSHAEKKDENIFVE